MKTILTRYTDHLKLKHNLVFDSYQELHKWSINEMSDFWLSIVNFFEVGFEKPLKQFINSIKILSIPLGLSIQKLAIPKMFLKTIT